MSKIIPTNGHILIEPIKHEGFMATQRDTYEEIGVVLAVASDLLQMTGTGVPKWPVKAGEKVYFDSWLAAKYPKENGKQDEYYWLVKWEDVRAIEYAEQEISK